jgi:hypothetical protein
MSGTDIGARTCASWRCDDADPARTAIPADRNVACRGCGYIGTCFACERSANRRGKLADIFLRKAHTTLS